MNKRQKEIIQMLRDADVAQTLSPEALTYLKETMEENNFLKRQLKDLEENLDQLTKDVAAMGKEMFAVKKENDDWSERKARIEAAEFDHRVREVTNKYLSTRGDEMKEVLLSLTRNTKFREEVYRNGTEPDGSSQAYPGATVNTNKNQTKTTEQE